MNDVKNTRLQRCPCCGVSSSNGDIAEKKYYDLLKAYAQLASLCGDQKALINASKEYLSNISLGVSSSHRPNKIVYEHNLFDLQQAAHLLNSAMQMEDEQNVRD